MLSYSAWEEGVRGTCPTHAGAQSHREEGQRIGKRDFTLGLQAGGWGGALPWLRPDSSGRQHGH